LLDLEPAVLGEEPGGVDHEVVLEQEVDQRVFAGVV
jgi:hypothetical protein